MTATDSALPASPAIRVEGVSKVFQTWASPAQRLIAPLLHRIGGALAVPLPRLSQRLQASARRRMHRHEALHDIGFELHKGEALGIIGLNGSGKSTLLQIIAGVLAPTSGTVETHGRIAALLELGSGFNPELTGRENIYINGAILGLARSRIDELLDEIIAFADIGDYIDQPVKTYSSGMGVRLAFAVQVHVEPDILIVDEALAVGDAAFQAKALVRIDEILARGTTLLFVGHDLNAVRAFCHRAMLLEKGRIVDSGTPDDVVVAYMQRNQARILQAQRRSDAFAMQRLADGYGVEDACVVSCTLNGQRHASLAHGERIELQFEVRLRPDLRHPGLTVDIVDPKGLQLSGRRIPLPRVDAVRTVPVSLGFDAVLQQGLYRLRMRVVDMPSLEQTTILSRQDGHLSFEVVDDCRERFTGLFPLPMDIRVGA